MTCSIRARPPRVGVGLVGELHPAVLDGDWGAFELDLAKLFAVATRTSGTRT